MTQKWLYHNIVLHHINVILQNKYFSRSLLIPISKHCTASQCVHMHHKVQNVSPSLFPIPPPSISSFSPTLWCVHPFMYVYAYLVSSKLEAWACTHVSLNRTCNFSCIALRKPQEIGIWQIISGKHGEVEGVGVLRK